ncbi:lipoyl protein ligase domain-containing protein [Roseibacillus ishigakijimensis]|uniref:BPL/LPL catalytic domain-containing protein n=1 Tax=Roseibacillus ishigakijimensis TaxID=454146 RepID=A0A934VNZ5_9BACT|nr:hypothetical protein [Roseibacillus ishigakijimensis]MBK1835576.1 hypothetical protein [Roseibacillus ishigakijimensis]
MPLIIDPAADGPTNMARDQELLARLGREPVLRIYQWAGDWASYGYFQTEEMASAHFANANLQFVRRPTGGGLVDHRRDLTYTLLLPRSHPLACCSRAESYREIHHLVQKALAACGYPSELLAEEQGDSPACFVHPVPGDIVDVEGKKLAGAAQRRTRHGLLHQGSILAPGCTLQALATAFAELLAPGD